MKKLLLILVLSIISNSLMAMSSNPRYLTPSEKFHIVKKGDSLDSISSEYKISKERLMLFNNLKSEKIYLGQKIYLIPKPTQWHQYITVRDIPQKGYHIVRPKETIHTIAEMYDLQIIDLIDINNLSGFSPNIGTKIYLEKSVKQETQVAKIAPTSTDLLKKIAAPPPSIMQNTKVTLPVSGTVTSEFGIRNGRPHKGIDIANKKGTPIVSALAGNIVFSGRQRGYGNVVIIEHSNSVMTVYAHNETNLVREGEMVKQGQPIATLGSTGVSSAPHLHFEYRKNGRAINPRDVIPTKFLKKD